MAGEIFSRLFWDILTEVVDAQAEERPPAGGGAVHEARVAVVIEDEADIRSLLADVLEQAGFTVHTAETGLEGIALVQTVQPIVTTLDVNMPGMDGFETAKRIRATSGTYIVMLSARIDEIDALLGLEAGADDYITKPFRPRELRARVEAMLRRPRVHTGTLVQAPLPVPTHVPVPAPVPARTYSVPPDTDGGWLRHKGLRLHPESRISALNDEPLELTRSEFDILAQLLEGGRRVRSKGELAGMLRGGEVHAGSEFVSESDSRAIEVHMANIRRKLGESPREPRWIETVRGVGYRLTAS